VVDNSLFCVHGGLSPSVTTISQVSLNLIKDTKI
jgi:hypothetical protein